MYSSMDAPRMPDSQGVIDSDVGQDHKPLGEYLVDAGLLTPAQLDVALNDQKLTGMRFGEILDARGWVKQQTVEFVVEKVVERDRREAAAARTAQNQAAQRKQAQQQEARRREAQNQAALRQQALEQEARREAAEQERQQQIYAESMVMRSRPAVAPQTPTRREVPIAKPLPSVPAPDGDVSWVG